MVLQHIVWPEKPEQEEKELYYHGTPEYTEDGNLLIKAGENLTFDTYFNSFSGKTWLENTVVCGCEFQFEVQGKGTLYLKTDTGAVIGEAAFHGESSLIIPLEKIEKRIYYPELLAEDDTVLKSGGIVTSQPGKDVHLVLATCTYNRQEDIKRNLNYLKQKNRHMPDGEKVLEHIYVVDNARNLKTEDIEDELVSLIPNPNTGGAGGFTRGLKEARKEPAMTHVLLMDDDVKMEFEAIVRTKSMLRYIKKEKEDCFIGGAMFRRDVPYVLHAAGEIWNNGRIINPHKNTDMRQFQTVAKVTEPLVQPQTYAGWWYCCIPRTHIENGGYPIPFFLHCDDVEYSLRNGRPPIYMNGIAVWHEEFDDKRSSVMEYYDTRNRLITNALYMQRGKRRTAAVILTERFLASVLRYRYRDIGLTLLAVEDFLKGPEWLQNLDAESYHKQLAEYGYKPEPVEDVQLSKTGNKRSRMQTVLRYFFPAAGRAVLPIGALVGDYAGRKELLLVDIKSRKGFRVKKSWRETIVYAGKLLKCSVQLLIRYGAIEKQWKKRGRL